MKRRGEEEKRGKEEEGGEREGRGGREVGGRGGAKGKNRGDVNGLSYRLEIINAWHKERSARKKKERKS